MNRFWAILNEIIESLSANKSLKQQNKMFIFFWVEVHYVRFTKKQNSSEKI